MFFKASVIVAILLGILVESAVSSSPTLQCFECPSSNSFVNCQQHQKLTPCNGVVPSCITVHSYYQGKAENGSVVTRTRFKKACVDLEQSYCEEFCQNSRKRGQTCQAKCCDEKDGCNKNTLQQLSRPKISESQKFSSSWPTSSTASKLTATMVTIIVYCVILFYVF